MTKKLHQDVEYSDVKNTQKDRFPRVVMLIVMAELCERFSYSGMKAFLTLYLRSKLDYSDDGATEIYHWFCTLMYLFPIFGGILADSYLGKFRTILYMMYVYAAGNTLVALTAIPHLGLPARLCTMIGLFMITIGTGGIKPCVAAFGGDQFELPRQEKHLTVYFSILYFMLCTGSLVAKTVSPILRSEIQCFGDKDCYSVAFGAPGFVVLMSMVIFTSAKNHYVMKKPEGNVVFDVIKCITLGVKNLFNKNREKSAHWLDCTIGSYDKQFVQDIKKTLSILTLFTVLPVFWALLDQMGSRWTLQATKMDGDFWFFTVKPDQMQVLAPIFILIIIPVFQKCVYPPLEKRNILKNPLHKLVLGGILAGTSFIASGFLELHLKQTYPQLPEPGFSQIRIFNGYPCSVSITGVPNNITYSIPPNSVYTKKDVQVTGLRNMTLDVRGSCMQLSQEKFLLEDNMAVSFFISPSGVARYIDRLEKSRSGFPLLRFLVNTFPVGQNMTFYNDDRNEVEAYLENGVSSLREVFIGTYSIRVNNTPVAKHIKIESGGIYAAVIQQSSTYETHVIEVTAHNSVSMVLQIPQFFIISTAEVLFAVTGSEFAFKEAPDSMKAVLSAAWLLTEAIGNVIIIVVTRIRYSQETQFFAYSAMIFAAMVVFYLMAKSYDHANMQLAPTQQEPSRKTRSNSEVLYLQVKQCEEYLEH